MDRNRLLGGLAGGLIGGLLFAVVLQGADLIASVGAFVGTETAAAGWLLMVVIGLVLGAVYVATFGRLPHSWGRSALYGLAHGVIWWVVGVLLVTPLWMGYAIGTVSSITWVNLLGYLVYGLAVGLVTEAVTQRVEQRKTAAA